MSDDKPNLIPHPEPLPPAEHEKAVEQAEKQQRNLRSENGTEDDNLPQTHTSAD